MNVTSLPAGSNTRSTRKTSASVVEDDRNSLAATGPVISSGSVSGGSQEHLAVAERFVAQSRGPLRIVQPETHGLRIEIEPGPLRALERPFVLVPLDEFLAGMADLQLHARLLVPAGVLALEEVAEEAFLQADAVVRVEVRPVRVAVRLEPFLLGGDAEEALEVAARVQALPAPVRGAEHRDVDLAEIRRTLAARFVVERMIENEFLDIDAVSLRARLRSASAVPTPARRSRGCAIHARRGRVARGERRAERYCRGTRSRCRRGALNSRYQSAQPSQTQMAARCGGLCCATYHWFIAK